MDITCSLESTGSPTAIELEEKIAKWDDLNERACATIYLAVYDEVISHLHEITWAKEMWSTLKELYAPKDYVVRHRLVRELVTTTMANFSSVEEYFLFFKRYHTQLGDMGYPVPEWFLADLFLHNLGKSNEDLFSYII